MARIVFKIRFHNDRGALIVLTKKKKEKKQQSLSSVHNARTVEKILSTAAFVRGIAKEYSTIVKVRGKNEINKGQTLGDRKKKTEQRYTK